MSAKTKLRYEKPVSIDMGRVAPVLGDRCSTGEGANPCAVGNFAGDCSVGYNNASVPSCNTGGGADRFCELGLSAFRYCEDGSGAGRDCYAGDGY